MIIFFIFYFWNIYIYIDEWEKSENKSERDEGRMHLDPIQPLRALALLNNICMEKLLFYV